MWAKIYPSPFSAWLTGADADPSIHSRAKTTPVPFSGGLREEAVFDRRHIHRTRSRIGKPRRRPGAGGSGRNINGARSEKQLRGSRDVVVPAGRAGLVRDRSQHDD